MNIQNKPLGWSGAVTKDGIWVPMPKMGVPTDLRSRPGHTCLIRGEHILAEQKYSVSLLYYPGRSFPIRAGTRLLALSRAVGTGMMIYMPISGTYEGWYVTRMISKPFQISVGYSAEPVITGEILATARINGAPFRLLQVNSVPNTSFPARKPLWFADELFGEENGVGVLRI